MKASNHRPSRILILCSTLVSFASTFRPSLPLLSKTAPSTLYTVSPFLLISVDPSDVIEDRLVNAKRLESPSRENVVASGRYTPVSENDELSKTNPVATLSAQTSANDIQLGLYESRNQRAVHVRKDGVRSFRSLRKKDSKTVTSLEGGDLVCRVVARRDSKLPDLNNVSLLPNSIVKPPACILRRLDDLYHAQVLQETRLLKYTQRSEPTELFSQVSECTCDDDEALKEDKQLVMAVRSALEEAGFERLSRRDLDLCEALNAGYLLRLSILPEVSELDPNLMQNFYPECYDNEGNVKDPEKSIEKLLFDGRVLVYWRGYSQQVTRGRLLLPKIDHLQASVVQRLSGKVKRLLDILDRFIVTQSLAGYRKATACFIHYLRQFADRVPNKRLFKSLRRRIRSPYTYSAYKALSNNGRIPTLADLQFAAGGGSLLKLSRYGGSKIRFVGSPNPTDSLNPFIICEENDSIPCCFDETDCIQRRSALVDCDMYHSLNNNELRCPYDVKYPQSVKTSFQLLERVSISSLVDLFSREGRRNLIKTIFSKSELVEPTFEEVVVIWRPLPEKPEVLDRTHITLPQFAYDIADMFDIAGLPEKPKEQPIPARKSLEIRSFEGVPMANLPAILPKTKLVFRPADAFVFDLISSFSFLAIIGSIRFDSPKLDLIALVSVTLWIIRTLFRYSNKLARYDLLVKKFLTSKLSHRNSGALKYLASQASSQRASRAALMHKWLCSSFTEEDEPLKRAHLIAHAKHGVNALIDDIKETTVDFDAALSDLEDVGLVQRTDPYGQSLRVLRDENSIVRALSKAWRSVYEGRHSLRALVGRLRKGDTDVDPTPAP